MFIEWIRAHRSGQNEKEEKGRRGKDDWKRGRGKREQYNKGGRQIPGKYY